MTDRRNRGASEVRAERTQPKEARRCGESLARACAPCLRLARTPGMHVLGRDCQIGGSVTCVPPRGGLKGIVPKANTCVGTQLGDITQ